MASNSPKPKPAVVVRTIRNGYVIRYIGGGTAIVGRHRVVRMSNNEVGVIEK